MARPADASSDPLSIAPCTLALATNEVTHNGVEADHKTDGSTL